jgi:hypothetical protein
MIMFRGDEYDRYAGQFPDRGITGCGIHPDVRNPFCPNCRAHAPVDPVEPIPLAELAEVNPDLDQRGLRRLQALEQLIAEDDQACGYQDPED